MGTLGKVIFIYLICAEQPTTLQFQNVIDLLTVAIPLIPQDIMQKSLSKIKEY